MIAQSRNEVGGEEWIWIWMERAIRNGECLTAMPYCLKSTELYQEELRDSLQLQYGLFLLNLPTAFDGCGKKFRAEHTLLCPKRGIVLVYNNDDPK